ncbi:unnamed protein product [Cunninghamella echinulata]
MKHKAIFGTVDKFIEAFEMILFQHQLDLNTHRESCFIGTIQHGSLSSSFYLDQLYDMKWMDNETPLSYVDRYQQYLRNSGAPDSKGFGNQLLNLLYRSKHHKLADQIKQTHAMLNINNRPNLDVDYIQKIIPQLYKGRDGSDDYIMKTTKDSKYNIKTHVTQNDEKWKIIDLRNFCTTR